MECWIRSSAAFVLGGVVLIGSGGCDSGQQAADSSPAGGASQPAQASKPSPVPEGPDREDPGRADDPEPTDRHEIADRGRQGRSQGRRGAGRSDALRLPLAAVQARADQGRAADRRGARGIHPADRQGHGAGLQSADQGQVRAGPPALFRPAGLARRHGQLRHLPQPRQGLDRQPAGLGRDRWADRQPECADRPEYGVRPDDVLGRPGPVAGRPGAGTDPEPDRDGQPVVQEDHRAAAEDPGLQASSSRRSSGPP